MVRHGGIVQGSPAAVLARADSASLPLLGGMARPDGVVIASERFFAFEPTGTAVAALLTGVSYGGSGT